jgi:hypothetical protein
MNRPNKILKGNFTASQGGLSGLGPLRSDGSWDSQMNGPQERQPKVLKPKLAQGGPSGSSQLRSDGSCDGQGRGLDLVRGGQRCSKESWKITLESQGT